MAVSLQSSKMQNFLEEIENSNSDEENDEGSETEDNLEVEIQETTDSETGDLLNIPVVSSSISDTSGGNIRPRKRGRAAESDSSDDERNAPQDHSTNSQSSSSDLDHKIIHPGCASLLGKDGYKWSTSPGTQRAQTAARNILEGPQDKAKDVTIPSDIFSLFINSEMLEQVLIYTNAEIQAKRMKYSQQNKRIDNTTMNELKALLGLLLLSAGLESNHLPTRMLFNSTYSASRFKATMCYDRFEFLANCLRFDDKASRPTRQLEDKFAAFRTMWESFINNCQKYYSPGSDTTIDEQLVEFRGRCPFRIYFPSKPKKYGIKMVMLVDAKTKYVFNAMPYLGKESAPGTGHLADFFVKKLSEPIHGSNRNLIMDSWFSSVPLARELAEPPYNLTMVATLRTNKRQIPKELHDSKTRKVGTSMFCFDGDTTLVSYKPKSNKVVFLLSTTHNQPSINAGSGKPEIIEFYNSTKGAVDTVDQMCTSMSTNRKTQRWPLCLFYNMLNLTILNSYVIYVCNNTQDKKASLTKRDFILKVAEDLINEHLLERYNIMSLRRDVRESIREILQIEPNVNIVQPHAGPSRTNCSLCPSKARKMTTNFCVFCRRAICRGHNVNVCSGCAP